MKYYYVYNENFHYIGTTETEPSNSLWTDVGWTESFVKPTWDGTQWAEGATQQELEDYRKSQVPQEVQLWRIRTVLKLTQLEAQIETVLDSLPEPSKTAANYIWNYGTTVERTSQTVLLIQTTLQLTDEQVDDLFIQAEQILL
jgi:hypothetical protein